jgi:hypothetical protein
LSHCEILQLHRLEEVLDKYYNSRKFSHALREAIKLFPTPFDFYHGFAELWHQRGWFQRQWQGKALFDKLWEFLEGLQPQTTLHVDAPWDRIRDALRFDYFLWERPNFIPDYLSLEYSSEGREKADSWKTRQEEIRRDGYWKTVIPEFSKIDRRQWIRNTAVACFTTDILHVGLSDRPCWYLFYYQQGKVKAYLYQGNSSEGVDTPSED